MRPDSERFLNLGTDIGELVAEKNRQYGDAFAKVGEIMRILYPDGVSPEKLTDALCVVRVLDKLCRISERRASAGDPGGEDPWRDIAGYGLLGHDTWRRR